MSTTTPICFPNRLLKTLFIIPTGKLWIFTHINSLSKETCWGASFLSYLVRHSRFRSKDHDLPSLMPSRSRVSLNCIINKLKSTSLKSTRPFSLHRLCIEALKDPYSSIFPALQTLADISFLYKQSPQVYLDRRVRHSSPSLWAWIFFMIPKYPHPYFTVETRRQPLANSRFSFLVLGTRRLPKSSFHTYVY